mmetsp:Transcript_5812/g.17281  ORF Transcript_5812/g.17281 Transcript_5812/m.17281 type:complete len:288 (-) Transcript_5812:119-982(-)
MEATNKARATNPTPTKRFASSSALSVMSVVSGVRIFSRFWALVFSHSSKPSSISMRFTTPFCTRRAKRLLRSPIPNPMSSTMPNCLTRSASPSAIMVMSGSSALVVPSASSDTVASMMPMSLAHASLTNLSLVVTIAIVPTPNALSFGAASRKPGKCSEEHVGVYAPGMPTRMCMPSPPTTSAIVAARLFPLATTSMSISGKESPTVMGSMGTSFFFRNRPNNGMLTMFNIVDDDGWAIFPCCSIHEDGEWCFAGDTNASTTVDGVVMHDVAITPRITLRFERRMVQ